MGVPAFFRWLSRKYPSIVVHCDDGVKGQYDFDNLYLDMNGIIHPCSHPENKPPPANEEEMFLAIFQYVEDILKIVKPKKLLYMAVDGVAPRAKMNQQRSRRFRAAQESYDKLIEVNKVKETLLANGVELKEKEAHFDSNVITPGTQFMINLSGALRTWIDQKLSLDYADSKEIWPKDLVVILSDATVPGEGEHKIMDYIRKQKADPNYNPNVSHCLYGADADLIMLGLATHEPNFTILREEFKPNQPKPCDLCGQLGHDLKECTGEVKPFEDQPLPMDTEFIYIRINGLREYLQKECRKCKVTLDFERFIDDYVLLCFFVGNDFLPHLPSLEIRENAIDRLIMLYIYIMEAYPDHNDMYLTKDGIINKSRIEPLLRELGEAEDDIFKQRQQSDLNFKHRNKMRKIQRKNEELKWLKPEAVSSVQKPDVFQNAKNEAQNVRMAYNANANDKLNAMLVKKEDSNSSQSQPRAKQSRPHDDIESDSEPEDLVQLYNDGWKERYYQQKFDCDSVSEISKMVSDEYFKGLCWVLLYYYQGCPDWKWFFPFHYAPFASDFKDIAQISVDFDSNVKPFKPLEQLMSVFPAASSKNLPPTWRDLMTNTQSPIVDFYPQSFRIDLNGKKAAWMGVALLPFIDESRLFRALENVYGDLTEEEKFRNRLGSHLIFVSKAHPLLAPIVENVIAQSNEEFDIAQGESDVKLIAGTLKKSLLFSDAYKRVFCCEFNDPVYESGFVYPSRLLEKAKIPASILKPEDLYKFQNYRPVIGMNRRNDQAHLGAAGHRMVNRSVNHSNNRYRPYNYHHDDNRHNRHDDNNRYNRNRAPQQYGYNQRPNYSDNYNPQHRQAPSHQSNYSNYSYYQNANYNSGHQPYRSNNNRYNPAYNYNQQGGGYSNPPNNEIPSYYTGEYLDQQPNPNNNRQHHRQNQYRY